MNSPIITPTPGRIVWFTPTRHDTSMSRLGDDLLAAMVVGVHNNRSVNLVVHDARGNPHRFEHVLLLQDGDAPPEHTAYCEWMPYQKGQAIKHAEQAQPEPDPAGDVAPVGAAPEGGADTGGQPDGAQAAADVGQDGKQAADVTGQ